MTEASEAIFQDQVIRLAKMQGWLSFTRHPKWLGQVYGVLMVVAFLI